MNEQLNTYLYPFSLTLLFAISSIVSFKEKQGIAMPAFSWR